MKPIQYLLIALVLVWTGPALAEVSVEKVVSPGGLTAWLVRDETVPVTAIQFEFKGGGAGHDPMGREGTAQLLAATMDEGAGPYDSTAFRKELADQSISLGFSAGRDSFSGSVYTLNRYRDQAVELLRLSLTEPRFDEEPVERIRAQMTTALRGQQTDPSSRAGELMFETIFDGHDYARPTEGTEESVSAVTVDDLQTFRRTVLTKDRLFIGVVGAITPEELGPILDTVFGGLPDRGDADTTPDFDGTVPAGIKVVDMDVPQSTVLFAQQGIALDDPRYYTAMVLNHALGGGGFGSLLTDEIRVERGLVYSVYSFLHPMDHAALLRGGAGTANETVGEVVSLIRETFRKVKENGLSDDRINDAKTYLTGSFPLRFTNSSRIADQLVAMQVYGFPIDYFETRNERIESVTAEDVNTLAAELLEPDGLLFVIAGRPAGL